MWLLNTHTAGLKFFSKPDDVPGGYAIISHVWGNPMRDYMGNNVDKDPDEEDTFQKVRSVFEECQEKARSTENIPSSPTPSRDDPEKTISSLSAQVHDLSVQVRNLTAQLQALVSTLQERDPGLTAQLSTHHVPAFITQYPPVENVPKDMVSTSLPTDARDHLSPKIRKFLLKAEEHGFDWAWADTCCIDKTSSAELTEAINSMFQYYSRSEVCYAYLSDVPPAPTIGEIPPGLWSSVWHKRGWTLQELIAPKVVVFMASDWTRIGTKYELAYQMEGGTGGSPPASVLRFEKEITDMSIAERMSWAAYRQTTRVEDEAYCLFGLFGINIPTLYGEGRNAFYRLQEEIMRTSTDTSLIAWYDDGYDEESTVNMDLTLLEEAVKHLDEDNEDEDERWGNPEFGYLFAPAPSYFYFSSITSTRTWENDPCAIPSDAESPSFNITPNGIRAHLPITKPFKSDDDYILVNIFCESNGDESSPSSTSNEALAVYLLLRRDPTRPRNFFIPLARGLRIISLNPKSANPPLDFTWMDIYISQRPPYSPRFIGDLQDRLCRLSLDPVAPFRVGPGMLSALSHKHSIKLEGTSRVVHGWDGSSPISLGFMMRFESNFVVTLGRCTYDQVMDCQDATFDRKEVILGPRFITVQHGDELDPKYPSHDCNEDHVEEGTTRRWHLWPVGYWDLWTTPQGVQISLTRSHFDSGSGNMLEVHLWPFEV